MATSIDSLSAQLNALVQAGLVSDNATEVIATIPAGKCTTKVSFEKDRDYSLQQVHTEILLALQKESKASSTTTAEESKTPAEDAEPEPAN